MTVTVTPTVELSNVPPRVRLDISSTAETVTTVTRANPDGTTVNVRTGDGNPVTLTSGTGLIYDYEMPYSAAVSYSTVESPATVSAQVTVGETRLWLIHPGVPELSQPIDMLPGSLMEEVYTIKQGVFSVMGRSSPVVVTDGARKAAQSSLTVLTETLDERAAVLALVSDGGALLLNIPATLNLGFDPQYIAVQDIKVARLTDVNADVNRAITLPFVVVDMPVGGSQAERTYVDLLSYASYAQLKPAYSSYTALLAGP